jgi:hypothetical protein
MSLILSTASIVQNFAYAQAMREAPTSSNYNTPRPNALLGIYTPHPNYYTQLPNALLGIYTPQYPRTETPPSTTGQLGIAYTQARNEPSRNGVHVSTSMTRAVIGSNGVHVANSMTQVSTLMARYAEPGRSAAVPGVAGALSPVHMTSAQHLPVDGFIRAPRSPLVPVIGFVVALLLIKLALIFHHSFHPHILGS